MMIRGENSDSIPMDLIPEILSRLPVKSVTRFRCVSKPWNSIICRQDFTELFRTISSSKPRLLIVALEGSAWRVLSSPQPQNHYGNSSLVVAADFHTKLSRVGYFSYASGLFCFIKVNEDDDQVRVICNPITKQYVILPPGPEKIMYGGRSLLGFDSIGKQFKVLVYEELFYDGSVVPIFHILTLGTENAMWREIQCPFGSPDDNGICINGVLYYTSSSWIHYFDVMSEKFKIFKEFDDGSFNLINYKGKLCRNYLTYRHNGRYHLELHMWVLEDIEKEEWSKYAYTLSLKVDYDLSVVGMTASGEIVLAKRRAEKPFYVFYFNPETKTLQSVEIQGVREEKIWFCYHRFYCFVDHVEDLNFDVMKTTYADATSIRPPKHQVRTVAHLKQDRCMFESVNKFEALRLLEDD